MNYIKISKFDIANGEGVRVVLWLAGCSHKCKNCHNKETWDPKAGTCFDANAERDLFDAIAPSYIQGITISGGDPLFEQNRDDVIALLKRIHQKFPHKDIWLYTGYTWEEVEKMNCKQELTELVNVIVEGKFVQELYSISLLWRGSSNQRVIDVQKTVTNNQITSYIQEGEF